MSGSIDPTAGASLAAVILLGIFHGVNPGQGWLFAVFMGISRARRAHVPLAIGVVAGGHVAAVAPLVGVYLLLLPQSHLVPFAVAVALLVLGGYRLMRLRQHRRTQLKIRYHQLFLWSVLLGVSHASGVSLLPFVAGSAMMLMSAHFLATVATMLVMALLTTYVVQLTILRRMWINFDLVWGVVLLIIGATLFATSLMRTASLL